jgi:hypothetical protein
LIPLEYQLLTSGILTQKDILPVEQVFINRGIKPSDIEHYLHTTKEDILDPELLDNIDKGAKMFLYHLAKGSKIFV